MIIKTVDSKQEEIKVLSLLMKSELSSKQRSLVKRELTSVISGAKGEEDSAYYIDFHFGRSKNWAVIHDLRLEHEDQVAQIDHLLINRLFDIYVLESKNYSYGIRITPDGDFQAYYEDRYFGIPSPVEQNKMHIHLLERFLRDHELLSKRAGISIRPRFKNFILVSPKSIIKRPSKKEFDTSMVIKADTLRTRIDKEVDKSNPIVDMTSLTKLSSSSTIQEFARKLAVYHRPLKIDYRAKFGIYSPSSPNSEGKVRPGDEKHKSIITSKYLCVRCKKPISEKVAKFCLDNKTRFGGKLYCFDCQKVH